MADDHDRDELAELRAELALQQVQITDLLAERHRPCPRHRLPKRALPLALVALLIALMPLATIAADFAFLDLNAGSPHNDNIAAIKAAGITKGCNPPDYTQYCPNGLVTREEMASFLARTAGLGTNPPVANAKTAQTAQTAMNAAQLNGQPDTFYQPAGQPIADASHAHAADNAATLQGRAANQFSRVARSVVANNTDAAPPQPALNVTAAYPAFQSVTTVTIDAPTVGFLLVSASTIADTNNTHSVLLRVRDTTSNESSPYVAQFQPSTSLNGTLALTYVFPVGTGPRTVVLEASTNFTSAIASDHQIQNTVITALYVPFAQDGGSTLAP